MKLFRVITAVTLTCAFTLGAYAEEGLRILYLSKSSGFIHSVVNPDDSGTSLTDRVLTELAESMGAHINTTKDASLINAENLENYDVVIFYTSGNLTEEGNDGYPAMSETGVDELLAWIDNGGGFIGFHSATDTFRVGAEGEPNDFIRMIGGEFLTHGAQFEGILQVTSPEHPTMANFQDNWAIWDEWYLYTHLNEDDMHVLVLLEPGEEREKQEMYDIPAYPIIWCSAMGEGRILHNGMGHREDVWENPDFQQTVVDAINWAAGEGPTHAAPNYHDVVPEADAESAE